MEIGEIIVVITCSQHCPNQGLRVQRKLEYLHMLVSRYWRGTRENRKGKPDKLFKIIKINMFKNKKQKLVRKDYGMIIVREMCVLLLIPNQINPKILTHKK